MRVSLFLWLIFSPIAAVMAGLITFAEYSHHHTERGPATREAVRTALVTLLLFLVVGAVISFILLRVMK